MKILKNIVVWFEKHKKITFSLIVITFITMFLVSSIRGTSIRAGSPWLSVGYHMTVYAVFAFFLLAFLTKKKLDTKDMLITLAISLIAGMLDEIHQIFVPFRSATLEDVMIDLTGAIISVSLYTLIRRNYK